MATFFQFNCQKSAASVSCLIDYIRKNKLDTFLVAAQEPSVYKGKVTNFPGKNLFTAPRNPDAQPRAAIWASSNLNLWQHPSYTSRDMVTVTWYQEKFEHPEIYITSLYLDITANSFPPQLQKLVRHCNQTFTPLLILTDSNAHSSLWGSDDTNDRGELLEEFILENALTVLNRGNTPTFDCTRGQSIIDISLASPHAEDLIHHWRVLPDHMCSDHKCIELKLAPKPEHEMVRSLKNVDWACFKSACMAEASELKWPSHWTSATIEQQTTKIYDIINSALDEQTSLVPRGSKFRTPWYTGELKNEKNNLQKLHKKAKSNVIPWDTYVQARKSYAANIRKSKRQSWKKFTSDTDNLKSAAQLEKIIQNSESSMVNILKDKHGKLAKSPKESLEILLGEHFPMSTPYNPELSAVDQWLQSLETPKPVPDLNWISITKIKNALASFGPNKAAGPDSLKPKVLQELPNIMLAAIKRLFSACLALAYTPAIWRTSKTIFIPKPGKSDYTCARSFRPISLTSFLFKTLEKIVHEHISESIHLHSNQHAFRKGRSTDTALSFTIDTIEKSIFHGQYSLVVFLDIEGAFDNLALDGVEKALYNHDVHPKIIHWYMQYMRNRIATADVRGASSSKSLNRGTPQGGVLSPLMWNLAFDSLLEIFDGTPVTICGFADDAALVVSGPDPYTLTQLMNQALARANSWARAQQLTFSAAKSYAILFTRRNFDTDKLPKLTINNALIKYVSSTRYLGVIIDSKLNWSKHITQKTKEIKGRLMLLRCKLGKLWGPRPIIIKWIWSGILQPSLSYACHVWLRALMLEKNKSLLNNLQSLVMRLMGNFRRGTPTAGLEIALGFPPLDLVLTEIALKTFRRLQLFQMKPASWSGVGRSQLGHLLSLGKLHNTWRLPKLELEDITVPTPINCKATLEESSFEEGLDCGYNSLRIYTDGSKILSETGCGYSIHRDRSTPEISNASFYLGDKTSVFQAEVEAICRAAQDAAAWARPEEDIMIFSDSQSALRALFKTSTKSKIVRKCVSALNNLHQHHEVTLLWIKAHVGHKGNELADQHAKNGILQRDSLELTDIPFSPSYYRARATEALIAQWNNRWYQTPGHRQSKMFYPEVDPLKSTKIVNLDREKLSRLVRFSTGHNFLRKHQDLQIHKTRTLTKLNRCRLCEDDYEESSHIVAQCEPLWRIRSDAFYKPFLDNPIPWEVPQMVKFLQHPKIKSLENLPENPEGAQELTGSE
jgi:ribonuclease HI